jgi:hypothetical protein
MILIVLIEESPARVRGDEAVLGLRAIAVLPVVGCGSETLGNQRPVRQPASETGRDPFCVIMLSRVSILYCGEASRDKRFRRAVAVVKL